MSYPSLFSKEDLKARGTTINEFKKYIGITVDAVTASASYRGHVKGRVELIEKVFVNGFLSFRIELNGDCGTLVFSTAKEVVDFFEADIRVSTFDFNILCQNKKVCFVSYDDNASLFLYQDLKTINRKFSSVSIDSLHHFKNDDYEFYSLDRTIYSREYNIKRMTIIGDDFFQLTKEKESSTIFHIIKNGELLTACGKSLDMHIDTQDFSPLAIVCKYCSKKFGGGGR